MPISRLSATSCVGLELRPLPSTGVTRFQRYYGPLRHPRRPSLSLAGVRLRVSAPSPHRVSRVALDLRVPTCRRHYPGGPLGSDRSWDGLFQPFPFIPSGGGLPHPSARSATTLVVSRPAQRSLALRPVGSPSRQATRLSRRLRRFRYLHRRSDSYRLERPRGKRSWRTASFRVAREGLFSDPVDDVDVPLTDLDPFDQRSDDLPPSCPVGRVQSVALPASHTV